MSVCIDLLDPFIRKYLKNEHIPVITDRFSKMTKTIPMKIICAAEVAKHFVNFWMFN